MIATVPAADAANTRALAAPQPPPAIQQRRRRLHEALAGSLDFDAGPPATVQRRPSAADGPSAVSNLARPAPGLPPGSTIHALFPNGRVPDAWLAAAAAATPAVSGVPRDALPALAQLLGIPEALIHALHAGHRDALMARGVPHGLTLHAAVLLLVSRTYPPMISTTPNSALTDPMSLSPAGASRLATNTANLLAGHYASWVRAADARSADGGGGARGGGAAVQETPPTAQGDDSVAAAPQAAEMPNMAQHAQRQLQDVIMSALNAQTSPQWRLAAARSARWGAPAPPPAPALPAPPPPLEPTLAPVTAAPDAGAATRSTEGGDAPAAQ